MSKADRMTALSPAASTKLSSEAQSDLLRRFNRAFARWACGSEFHNDPERIAQRIEEIMESRERFGAAKERKRIAADEQIGAQSPRPESSLLLQGVIETLESDAQPSALAAFRARYPKLKPYAAAELDGRIVELISYPWPEGSGVQVNVREPGNPTTTRAVDADTLKPVEHAFEIFTYSVLDGPVKYEGIYDNLGRAIEDATSLSSPGRRPVAIKTTAGVLVFVTRGGGLLGDEVRLFA